MKTEERMAAKELKKRSEMDPAYQWNISAMFSDESGLDGQLQEITAQASAYAEKYSGHLTDDGKTLYEAYAEKDEIWRRLEKIYVYAHMKRDEDNSVARYQALADQCMSVIAAVSAAMSFFSPELLAANEKKILKMLDETEELSVYDFAIRDALRLKEHVLTGSEEAILAQMSEVTGATGDIFTMLNNADLTFDPVIGEDGVETALTHGSYIPLMQSHDRSVRKAAYGSMYASYKKLINTIAAAYNYNTKTDVITARIRKFGSSREAALSGDNIPGEVYDNLVSVVNEHLPAMHRYTQLRKKLLGTDDLCMYDMYVPLIELPKKDIPFEEGLDMMRRALQPLGEEYISSMNEGIAQGWIDVYENKGKTSGAYSFGCYDSYPYILLNYTNTLQDVFTIIHEMGHSMHSLYTRRTQPYIYGSHSIFTAETASTVNESLLMRHLLDTEDDPDMRRYLLNLYLEEFRTTLFRQTMFAEFEDLTHRAIEEGGQLTSEWLCDEYEKLNDKYYGPAIARDDTIRYEWARIPHFYNAFYVYKYATGYSAATAISTKILQEGKPAADRYIDFLKTGDSDHPIELLKIAGVDMSTPAPVEDAMKRFEEILDEFGSMVN